MFRYDGPIIEIINKATDLILLGLIWIVMCIPIITIGASTTAAYYVAFNQLNDKDGYVLSKFFKSFKLNFKQSTIVFVLTFVMIYFAAFNLSLVNAGVIQINNYILMVIIVANVCVIYEAMIVSYFSYSLLSKIEFTTKSLLKTAFLLGNKHILTSVLNVLIVFVIAFAVGLMPLLILFAGGAYILLSANLMKRVLIKYKPEVFDSIINDDASFKVEVEETKTFNENDILDVENKDSDLENQ